MANGDGDEFGKMEQKQHQEIYNRDDQPADQLRNGEHQDHRQR